MSHGRAALGLGLVAAYSPALTGFGPGRRRVTPRLAGLSRLPHVALTFDDGPDEVSTGLFLDLLDTYERRATFFVLGQHVAPHRGLVAEMSARGHEIAVHGWDHRCVALKSFSTLRDEIARTADLVSAVTDRAVRWYRPPYGVLSTPALVAARARDLTTVLWSAWGRDWEARATPASVVSTVQRTLAPGGTVLLHDSDRTSADRSWITTLAATGALLEQWAQEGVQVGPLGEHWPARSGI